MLLEDRQGEIEQADMGNEGSEGGMAKISKQTSKHRLQGETRERVY